MQKHFNIFQSYNIGDEKDIDRVVQLEDNITRAFLCTLSNVEQTLQQAIVKEVFNLESILQNEEFKYDLQNPISEVSFFGKQKKIVTIQRYKSNLGKSDFIQDKTVIDVLSRDYTRSEKVEIKNIINNAFREGNPFINLEKYGMVNITNSMFSSILNLIGTNRADGWIITEKNIVLVEAKIGNNEVSKYQLYRHLTKQNGFKINPANLQKGDGCTDYSMQHITWTEVYEKIQVLLHNGLIISEKDKFILNQFLSYLKMNGEILDFSVVFEDGIINRASLKSQFKLFLEKFDKKMNSSPFHLLRYGRKIDYLWDFYGLKHNTKGILSNPHYSISFSDKDFSLALTMSDGTFTESFFNNCKASIIEHYSEVLMGKTSKQLEQYYIGLQNYRLVDRLNHAQKGETFETFSIYGRMSEILRGDSSPKSRKKKLIEFLSAFPVLLRHTKQFEIGIQIDILQFEKRRINEPIDEQLRAINEELLKNPDKLIDVFYAFIENTYDIFQNFANLSPASEFNEALAEQT